MRRRTFIALPAAAGVLPGTAEPETTAPPIEWKARWIWHAEQRTLPGTFILFRKVVALERLPEGRVEAWVSGHSRYQLWVNGQFVQRGPAPCDPRYWDVDPVDLAPYLRPGKNVIGALVCFFGGGAGTYVPPAPLGSGEGQGFLFQCDTLGLATGSHWLTARPRCWRHGGYQRWFLRALQEEFDARYYPAGWAAAEFDDSTWMPAMESLNPPGRPNLQDLPREGWHPDWVLQPRTIPALKEKRVRPQKLAGVGWVEWRVTPEEYFECFPAGAFHETKDAAAAEAGAGLFPVRVAAPGHRSAAVTFEFEREVAGHPYVKLRAPAGTVAEVLFTEKQTPGKLLLRGRPKFGQWLRVTCREGVTEYEAFEYEALRQLQVLVRNSEQPVEILDAGVRERSYDWPHEPDFRCSDAAVQRALQASANTHRIVSQETLVDNVTRERQQYAGDLDQAKLASYYAFGETRQPARMLRTFAQGQSKEGWFMDSWPAWDRCQRLYQRHLSLSPWGPIIDHAMQFGIAAAEHHLWTGDRELLAGLTPRMERFDEFLRQNAAPGGLVPVEGWTWNTVWIDHIGYISEQDKHCALNIYWAGFLKQGLARLLEWNGSPERAAVARRHAASIIEQVRKLYWSDHESLFIDNLPRQENGYRLHARTLAMALLFGAVPQGRESRCLRMLESFPTASNESMLSLQGGHYRVGFNYPLNEIWRLWALGRYGRAGVIVKELRERWANLPSVLENATYAEMWNPQPSESGDVWCQSNPVPLVAFYQELLGVRPTEPGFAAYDLWPQPGGLDQLSATIHSPRGAIRVEIDGKRLRWASPGGVRAALVTARGRRMMPVAEKEQIWDLDLA